MAGGFSWAQQFFIEMGGELPKVMRTRTSLLLFAADVQLPGIFHMHSGKYQVGSLRKQPAHLLDSCHRHFVGPSSQLFGR